MLIIDRKIFGFNVKEIYFADQPFDIKDCDGLVFQYCKNKVEADGFKRNTKYTSIIDLTQSLDEIWQNMNRKSTRHSIIKAQKQEIKIKINKKYEQFYNILKSIMEHKGFGSYLTKKKENFETIKRYGTCFTAEYKNNVLGGNLYFEDKDNIILVYSASKRFTVSDNIAKMMGNINRLLQWEAIKYAKEKGIKTYDMGGLWSEEEAEQNQTKKGINFFKLSFGSKKVTRYEYVKSYSKIYNLAYHLYNL